MGAGLRLETGRAQASYTNPAMTDSLTSLSIKFISARSLREKPQSILGGRGAVGGEQREKSDLSPHRARQTGNPSPRLHS